MLAEPVASRHFTEAEELLAAVPSVVLRATPTCAGPFRASLDSLRLDGLDFQTGSCSPAMIMAQAAPSSSIIQLPFAGTETFILNGRPLAPGLVGLYGGGSTLERASRQTTRHAVLVMPAEMASHLLMLSSSSPLLRAGGQGLVQAHPRLWQRAVDLVRAIAEVMTADASTFREAEARRSVRTSLLNAAQGLICGDPESGRPRDIRTSPARRRIVNMVDEYLMANISRPIYTEDLCEVLNISPARLAEAFRASFGVTPHRFLKLRRIAMVRAVLSRRDGAPVTLVRNVALEHGFWHLGQFARDYRMMYGEPPSETLARAWGLQPAAQTD